MERGYVKLWRKTLDNGIIKDEAALKVFIWLMLTVSWKPKDYNTAEGILKLEPGQWVIGRRKLALELGLSEKQIRTALKRLQAWQMVDTKGAKAFSVITLLNWDKYQSENQEGPTKGQAWANEGPSMGQARATNKEGNQVSIEEGKNETLPLMSAVADVRKIRKLKPGLDLTLFEDWYRLYPRKDARADGEKAWHSLTMEQRQAAIEAIRWQRDSTSHFKDKERDKTPLPATWLNGKRWTDEKQSTRGNGRGDGYAPPKYDEF